MGQVVKLHKIIPILWACPMFPFANFALDLVCMNIEKFDMKFVTAAFAPPYL